MQYPVRLLTKIQYLAGTVMLLLETVPRLIVEPIQPPKQLVTRSRSLGLKQLNLTSIWHQCTYLECKLCSYAYACSL